MALTEYLLMTLAALVAAAAGWLAAHLLALRETRRLCGELAREKERAERAGREAQSLSSRLDEARVRLRAAEGMSTIGRVALGVAHDINNPLAYVSANLEMLSEYVRSLSEGPRLFDEPGCPFEAVRAWASSDEVACALDEATRSVSEALDGCMRIRELTLGLRALSSHDQKVAPASLAMLAADSVRVASARIRQTRVLTHLEDPLPVKCVRGDMARVITNLVVNAGQACGHGGLVTVTGWREGGQAVIEIADNGPGITPEMRARVFDPFFTTKPADEGSGLGLSISRDLIRDHGGELRLYSIPGHGARFQVRLALERSEDAKDAYMHPGQWEAGGRTTPTAA